MKKNDKPTINKKLLTDFAEEVFNPFVKGESATCMFAAGGGKRTIFKYLLTEEAVLQKIFKDEYDRTIFVFVDPDEIMDVTSEAYLTLILENLILEMEKKGIQAVSSPLIKNPLLLIKKNVEKLLSTNNKLIFVLNDFEFTLNLSINIYLNLESILDLETKMSSDKSAIGFLFLSTINLFDESTIKNFQNLKHPLSQNIKYFPLFGQKEVYYLLDQLRHDDGKSLNIEEKKSIFEMCGGHPRLLKNVFAMIGKHGIKKILSDYKLKIICADIWNFFTEKERKIIQSVVTIGRLSDPESDEVRYLENLGIIKKVAGEKWEVFGTIFKEFVKHKIPKQRLTFDPESKKIFCGSVSCGNKFSFQEFRLIVYFLSHENDLTTRDQVAEAIWGSQYLDKYSDWSIDKIISILRKKLDAIGFPSENLVTLKKRGFTFANLH